MRYEFVYIVCWDKEFFKSMMIKIMAYEGVPNFRFDNDWTWHKKCELIKRLPKNEN